MSGHAWTIDVCRYCGRLAKWPGCEHWQKHDGWAVPVVVRPTAADARKLDRVIERAFDDESDTRIDTRAPGAASRPASDEDRER